VRLHDVVVAPAQVAQQVGQLAGFDVAGVVDDAAPGQRGHRVRGGQAELHLIAGVVVAAGQVQPDIGAVGQVGVTAPGDSVVGRQFAGALDLVEEHGILQRLGVVELAGRLRGGQSGAGADRRDDRTAGQGDADREQYSGQPADSEGPGRSHTLLLSGCGGIFVERWAPFRLKIVDASGRTGWTGRAIPVHTG
jgi:hypothetical protein